MNLLATLGLGLLLGLRHATDADHLAAVTAITTRSQTLSSALRVGLMWGVGHTATVLLFGGAIVLFGLVIPPNVGQSLEMVVAAMLVLIGLGNIASAAKPVERAEPRPDAVLGEPALATPTARLRALAVRPLFVGGIHGLAGSAGIALLVLATAKEPAMAMLHLTSFGLGSIMGMALLAAPVALVFRMAARRFIALERGFMGAAGTLSIIVGLVLGYEMVLSAGWWAGSAQ